jgi:hypothetical protein
LTAFIFLQVISLQGHALQNALRSSLDSSRWAQATQLLEKTALNISESQNKNSDLSNVSEQLEAKANDLVEKNVLFLELLQKTEESLKACENSECQANLLADLLEGLMGVIETSLDYVVFLNQSFFKDPTSEKLYADLNQKLKSMVESFNQAIDACNKDFNCIVKLQQEALSTQSATYDALIKHAAERTDELKKLIEQIRKQESSPDEQQDLKPQSDSKSKSAPHPKNSNNRSTLICNGNHLLCT